jgi:uncharacterized protein
MSQENKDLLREAIGAFNRIAEVGVEGVPDYLRFLDPEVQFEPQQAPLHGSYVGIEGVRAWFADITELYEHWHIDVDELRDHDDWVLGLGTLRVTGKGSGVKFEEPWAITVRYRQGLITEFKDHRAKEQALDALGLAK